MARQSSICFVCNFRQATRCCVVPPPRKFSLMRKPIALLLFGFVAASSYAENTPSIQSTPAGLPKDVVPRSYLIHLEPNIETRLTDGVESIEIEVLKPTNQIVLNTLDTQIAKARIEIGDRREELAPQFDSNRQTVSFELKNVLQPGEIHSVDQVSKQDCRTTAAACSSTIAMRRLTPSNPFGRPNCSRPMQDGSFRVGMNRHFGPHSS